MLRLHVVGESHADGFIGSCVVDDAGRPLAVAQVTHVPGLHGGDFLEADGRIGEKIVLALATARLVIDLPGEAPAALPHAVMGPNRLSPSWAEHWGRVPFRGALLFVCGGVDARRVFVSIPNHADIEVPFAPEETARIPGFAATAIASFDSVQQVVALKLAPLFGGMRLLRDRGFGPLFLHSISPCTPDDEAYRMRVHPDTRALTRYKAIMLFNAALREFCAREGFGFIDRWSDVTEGGLVREGFLFDAVHLRREHMLHSLAVLYRAVTGSVDRLGIVT